MVNNTEFYVDRCDKALVNLYNILTGLLNQNQCYKKFELTEVKYDKNNYNTPYFIFKGNLRHLRETIENENIRAYLEIVQLSDCKTFNVSSKSGLIKFDEEFNNEEDDVEDDYVYEPPTYQALLRSGYDFDHSTM